jgi:hypothetical protein
MPHLIKGQKPERYRPSVGRNVKLESIRQSVPSSNMMGWHYNRNNLLTLLEGRRPVGSSTLGPNVPPWGAPRNRTPLQTLIYNARKKYASAKTQAAKNAVLNAFARNHSAALNTLRQKHIRNLEELNALLRQTPNNRLSRSLNIHVTKLLTNLRRPVRPRS